MKRILLFVVLVLFAATWLNLSAGNVDAAAIKNLGGCGDSTLGPIDDSGSMEFLLRSCILASTDIPSLAGGARGSQARLSLMRVSCRSPCMAG